MLIPSVGSGTIGETTPIPTATPIFARRSAKILGGLGDLAVESSSSPPAAEARPLRRIPAFPHHPYRHRHRCLIPGHISVRARRPRRDRPTPEIRFNLNPVSACDAWQNNGNRRSVFEFPLGTIPSSHPTSTSVFRSTPIPWSRLPASAHPVARHPQPLHGP